MATNIPSFWRKTKKSYFLSCNQYQETSTEHYLYNDKVAINIVLNIIKHEWRTSTNSMKRQTCPHCRPSLLCVVHMFKKKPYANIRAITGNQI